MITDTRETVECKLCGTPTPMLGTRCCDRCWELEVRILANPDLASKILLSGTVITYLVDVLLLCAQCHEPIKARINTPNWLRVEWIGPSGECLKCYQESKRKHDETLDR